MKGENYIISNVMRFVERERELFSIYILCFYNLYQIKIRIALSMVFGKFMGGFSLRRKVATLQKIGDGAYVIADRNRRRLVTLYRI